MTNIELAKKQLNRIKYKILDSGCKIAINSIDSTGYAVTTFNGCRIGVHRLVAFAYLNLDLNDSNKLSLHIKECPNRNCFSEGHLYIGSYKDNAIDKSSIGHHPSQMKTLCKYGHSLDWKQKDSKTGKYYRSCLTCKRLANKKHRGQL